MAQDVVFKIKIDGVDKSVTEINKATAAVNQLDKAVDNVNDNKVQKVGEDFSLAGNKVSESFSNAQAALTAFGVQSDSVIGILMQSNAVVRLSAGYFQTFTAWLFKTAVAQKTVAVATTIWTAVQKVLNIVMAANPIGAIITAIALFALGILALIKPIKTLIQNMTWLNDILKAVGDSIRNFLSFISSGLIDDAATKKTQDNAKKIVESFDEVMSVQNKLARQREYELSMLQAQGASEDVIHRKKLDNITAEMAALVMKEKALKQANATQEEIDKNTLEIQALQNKWRLEDTAYRTKLANDAKKNKGTTTADAPDNTFYTDLIKARDKGLSELAKLEEAFQDLKDAAYLSTISDLDKRAQEELRLIQKREQDKLQIQIDTLANAGVLTLAQEQEYQDLLDQQYQMYVNNGERMEQLITEQQEKRKNLLNEFEKQVTLDSISNQYDRAREELRIEEEKLLAEAELLEASEEIKKEIRDRFREEKEKIDIEQKNSEIELEKEKWFAIIDQTQQYLNSIASINELYNNYEVASLERKLANKQISEEQYEEKLAELKYKQAKRDKIIAVFQAVINTASAIAEALPNVPLSIIAGALGAIQIGLILATPVPKASGSKMGSSPSSSGGSTPAPSKFASGGLVSGPGSSLSDSITAMLSNGESVMNANSTDMFGGLLSTINQAGGGAPIGDATAQGTPIIKTYVVSSDMTTQQEADKKVRDLARL